MVINCLLWLGTDSVLAAVSFSDADSRSRRCGKPKHKLSRKPARGVWYSGVWQIGRNDDCHWEIDSDQVDSTIKSQCPPWPTSGRLPHGIYHFWMVYTMQQLVYTIWYIPYGIYHGIYHMVYTMIYTMVYIIQKWYIAWYTMIYSMVYTLSFMIWYIPWYIPWYMAWYTWVVYT
jgi:hypothetical protein